MRRRTENFGPANRMLSADCSANAEKGRRKALARPKASAKKRASVWSFHGLPIQWVRARVKRQRRFDWREEASIFRRNVKGLQPFIPTRASQNLSTRRNIRGYLTCIWTGNPLYNIPDKRSSSLHLKTSNDGELTPAKEAHAIWGQLWWVRSPPFPPPFSVSWKSQYDFKI